MLNCHQLSSYEQTTLNSKQTRNTFLGKSTSQCHILAILSKPQNGELLKETRRKRGKDVVMFFPIQREMRFLYGMLVTYCPDMVKMGFIYI